MIFDAPEEAEIENWTDEEKCMCVCLEAVGENAHDVMKYLMRDQTSRFGNEERGPGYQIIKEYERFTYRVLNNMFPMDVSEAAVVDQYMEEIDAYKMDIVFEGMCKSDNVCGETDFGKCVDELLAMIGRTYPRIKALEVCGAMSTRRRRNEGTGIVSRELSEKRGKELLQELHDNDSVYGWGTDDKSGTGRNWPVIQLMCMVLASISSTIVEIVHVRSDKMFGCSSLDGDNGPKNNYMLSHLFLPFALNKTVEGMVHRQNIDSWEGIGRGHCILVTSNLVDFKYLHKPLTVDGELKRFYMCASQLGLYHDANWCEELSGWGPVVKHFRNENMHV